MKIHEAPHGINLVVETSEKIYIGRFDQTNGFEVVMHDCAVHAITDPSEADTFIKNTAKYGVAVDERGVGVDSGVRRSRARVEHGDARAVQSGVQVAH